jgi:hypothetical protein
MNVTARWIERMKALTKLEKLRLQGCGRVGDDAIAALSAMPALREVDLKGTAVTEKGAAMLRSAKPKAVVHHGEWVARTASFRNN